MVTTVFGAVDVMVMGTRVSSAKLAVTTRGAFMVRVARVGVLMEELSTPFQFANWKPPAGCAVRFKTASWA